MEINATTSITIYIIYLIYTLISERKIDLIIYDLTSPYKLSLFLTVFIWSYYNLKIVKNTPNEIIHSNNTNIPDESGLSATLENIERTNTDILHQLGNNKEHRRLATIKSLLALTIAYFARLDLYIPCFWLFWIIVYYYPHSDFL